MVPPILPDHPEPPARIAPDASVPDADTDPQLYARIMAEFEREGFLSFARFMELALHAPGLGYYAGGATKFGPDGDFVTAPEISDLFGRTLANPLGALIAAGCDAILELGAGSGKLAVDLLSTLHARGAAPGRYLILEISAELRARQQALLHSSIPELMDRIQWIDRLPARFEGIVLGNEVLDAIPVELVTMHRGEILQRGLALDPVSGGLIWATRPAVGELRAVASALELPEGYSTEIHLLACGLVRTLARMLDRGVLLFFDYGFPRREYYHPQRSGGTLMCHFRHRAHPDPLRAIGRQDITAHLDFTALAEAAVESGLQVLGYTSQAQFLLECGMVDALRDVDPADAQRYAPLCTAVQRLTSPAEMGELFKVIAFGRGIDPPLIGFRTGDRRGRL